MTLKALTKCTIVTKHKNVKLLWLALSKQGKLQNATALIDSYTVSIISIRKCTLSKKDF